MPRVTITMPSDLLEQVKARAGARGVSSWLAQAAADRLALEQLGAAISEFEASDEPITDDDIARARARTAWRSSRVTATS